MGKVTLTVGGRAARLGRMPSRSLRVRSSAPTSPRRVLVTGGASGLGLALVRALVARGDHVLATDLQADRPDALPEAAAYLPLDVRSDDAWAAALAHVRETWGGLDLLVNNAGVAAGGRIDVATMDEWHWIVDINLLGVVRGCRTFTPLLKEQGNGHIVNTASLAGLVHAPGMAAYNTVKAGVVALSETLSHELAPHGIDVSVVCPSFFRTNLGSSFQGADTRDGGGRQEDGQRVTAQRRRGRRRRRPRHRRAPRRHPHRPRRPRRLARQAIRAPGLHRASCSGRRSGSPPVAEGRRAPGASVADGSGPWRAPDVDVGGGAGAEHVGQARPEQLGGLAPRRREGAAELRFVARRAPTRGRTARPAGRW